MVNIIGRKIIMQEDDDSSFNIILKDHKGNEVPLTDTDVVTLRMKYSMESNIPCFRKKADVVLIDEKIYHIFRFSPTDTVNLLGGDYYYDVILENENKRFTVVPKSILTLEKPVSTEAEVEDSVIVYDTEGIDYYSIISATPLVGTFNGIHYGGSSVVIDTHTDSFDNEILIF